MSFDKSMLHRRRTLIPSQIGRENNAVGHDAEPMKEPINRSWSCDDEYKSFRGIGNYEDFTKLDDKYLSAYADLELSRSAALIKQVNSAIGQSSPSEATSEEGSGDDDKAENCLQSTSVDSSGSETNTPNKVESDHSLTDSAIGSDIKEDILTRAGIKQWRPVTDNSNIKKLQLPESNDSNTKFGSFWYFSILTFAIVSMFLAYCLPCSAVDMIIYPVFEFVFLYSLPIYAIFKILKESTRNQGNQNFNLYQSIEDLLKLWLIRDLFISFDFVWRLAHPLFNMCIIFALFSPNIEGYKLFYEIILKPIISCDTWRAKMKTSLSVAQGFVAKLPNQFRKIKSVLENGLGVIGNIFFSIFKKKVEQKDFLA